MKMNLKGLFFEKEQSEEDINEAKETAYNAKSTDTDDEEKSDFWDSLKENPKKLAIIATVIVAVVVVIIGIVLVNSLKSNDSTSGSTDYVPNYIGQDSSSIEEWAGENGYTIEVEESDSSQEQGTILSQKLDGKTIFIKISSGTEATPEPTVTAEATAEPTPTATATTGTVSMEDLGGYSLNEAKAWLTERGLTYTTVGEYSGDVARDYVIRTNPAGGRTVKTGGSIAIYYSLGKPYISDVTGQTKEQALSTLSTAIDQGHVLISYAYEDSSTVDSGKVIKQSVVGEVDTYSTVTLTLSTGASTAVADYSGKDIDVLKKWAKDYGLNVSVTETYNTSKAYGIVIENNRIGEKLLKGDTISATVSLGSYQLPNYIGKDIDTVVSEIQTANSKNAGVKIEKTEEYSTTYAKGIVMEQKLSGSTVYLTVSKGADDSSYNVPDFTGTEVSVVKKSSVCQLMACKYAYVGKSSSVQAGKEVVVSNDSGTMAVGSTIVINYVIGE